MMRSMISAAALAMLSISAHAQTRIDPETGMAPPGASVAPGQERAIDARRPNTTGSIAREGADAKAPGAAPAGRVPDPPVRPSAPRSGKGGSAGSPGG